MDVEAKHAVEAAEARLECASARRAEAQEALAAADREVVDAEVALADAVAQAEERGELKVHFKDIIDLESTTFHVHEDRTLQEVWDKAYHKFETQKRERDVLQARHEDGRVTSLMEHLALTLKVARERDLCGTRFEIATGTGGA